MDSYISKDSLIRSSSDDESDTDLVTDYTTKLNTPNIRNYFSSNDVVKQTIPMLCSESGYSNGASKNGSDNLCSAWKDKTINLITPIGQNNNNNLNMLPIISVTPHSPGSKYNNILEDSLCHLQSIRETVQQMKNPSAQNTSFGSVGPTNSTLVSTKNFCSCPSLSNETSPKTVWLAAQRAVMYTHSGNRRKSWTAVEDLAESTKNSHKSVSLTSLDSEDQESLRANERLHNRTNRNSTGGISTHSLNEAELKRDFEKLAVKRNLTPSICRIPLQKSISTPSIAQAQSSKEESNEPEVFQAEKKRRKRSSLFSRKKKDKTKVKGQFTNCDICGTAVELALYKEHVVECNLKQTKSQHSKSGPGKKHTTSSHEIRDYYEHAQNENTNFSDDTPLIRDEFLNEALIGPHDLVADHILGVAIDEYDSWSPSVPKEVVKSLKDKQVKRQEHIYEFLMTEKHHCQTLLVMQKVFVDSLQRHFNNLNLERMFPKLQDLQELHLGLLKKLRLKQKENYVIDSIADILVDFFSGDSAQKLKNAYGEFCSNNSSALDTFKWYLTENQKFSEWYKHCLQNPLLKKKGIPECILFVTQRLTKYPLLIQPLLKSSVDDKIEHEKLTKADHLVKEILRDVDSRVAEKDKEDRQLEIFKRIDAKSYAILKLIDERSDSNGGEIKEIKFKKSDVISDNRKFKFEGAATLMQGGRSKVQAVQVIVLSDCLFFLVENSNKYSFFNPENKAGVVTLQKLLIRAKADSRGNSSDSRGIYIISSNPANPEMYELKVQNPKDKNLWIQAIRAAVLECSTDDSNGSDHKRVSANQNQKFLNEKQANIRDLIGKMRQKDFEQAIVLEEKIALQLELLLDRQKSYASAEQLSPGVNAFLSSFGTYRDLVFDDCDPVEVWKRALTAVQDISQLASSLYTAATGFPLSRSFGSVGDRQSEIFVSPTLPKRAETFAGFDERGRKANYALPSRDAGLSNLSPGYFSNRDQNEKRRPADASEFDSVSCYGSSNTNLDDSHNETLKDSNYASLQVSHNLHTLLCIVSQQMTTIQSLQSQLNTFRDNNNPKTMYRHNDQLEELRNLQDRLQEEKISWMKIKEQQEKEIEESLAKQKVLQDLIKKEQQDIQVQREQLYRKMEILSNQGLLISPNVAIPVNPVASNPSSETDGQFSIANTDDPTFDSLASGRRKDRWKPAPAVKSNVVASPKVPMRQQLPLKLSSLSSAKSSSNVNVTTPTSNVPQMLPLKLADKRNVTITPSHSRTGSSPAIIQQQFDIPTGAPATRTNTYPKFPERYRVRSTEEAQTKASVTIPQEPKSSTSNEVRSVWLHGSPKAPLDNNLNGNDLSKIQNRKDKKGEEEVIYF